MPKKYWQTEYFIRFKNIELVVIIKTTIKKIKRALLLE
jgi:hypothetical protein